MIKIFVGTAICLLAQATSAQSYVPEKNNPKVLVNPVIHPLAYGFNLRDVRLLASPFRHAMELDSGYLLSLSADRLLHRFYTNAGLTPKAPVYGGWESEGLSGHTLGHYLSACSMMYASTGSDAFKRKVAYIVTGLAICQDARKTGYVGAIPNEDTMWAQVARGDIRSSGFDLNGGWSPWYTVHKVLAGLLDAYLYCDNQQALTVAIRLGDWTGKELSGLDEAQLQHMLACEFGGMSEALTNLYALTANKKYLELSYKFQHKAILDPLAAGKDPLPGKHSNTQIPKILGCARRYEVGGDRTDSTIAQNFWDIVVRHHSYVIGGNSDHEYLGEADHLSDYLSESTCESCNTYNMLKLTRHLFAWKPDSRLEDFYERALYNHILASQNPKDAMMCYFVPLRMDTRKQFSDSINTFTCCVGSGMENHSKYGEDIYDEAADGGLYVNLFIPSVLNWKERGIRITQQTNYPYGDKVTLEVSGAASFALRIRHPWWATQGVQVLVNGRPWASGDEEGGYIVVRRSWRKGDKILLTMPMHLYAEAMPDNPNRVALLYGPLVLAGDLGDKKEAQGMPVLLTADRQVTDWIKPVSGKALTFQTYGVGKPADITLHPFFDTYDHYYSVYWDYFTPVEWTDKQVAYVAEERRRKEIEARTADVMRLGEMQPERDHHLQSAISYVGEEEDRPSRECRNGGYFSFDMTPGDSLLVTAWGGDEGRVVDILVDDTLIATQALHRPKPNEYVDLVYAIPPALIAGKTTIKVTFRAPVKKSSGSIFGVRTVQSKKS